METLRGGCNCDPNQYTERNRSLFNRTDCVRLRGKTSESGGASPNWQDDFSSTPLFGSSDTLISLSCSLCVWLRRTRVTTSVSVGCTLTSVTPRRKGITSVDRLLCAHLGWGSTERPDIVGLMRRKFGDSKNYQNYVVIYGPCTTNK